MEYIKKPFWLEDYVVSNISKKFKDFLETFNLEEESEIDLNILRKYYKKDKIKAMILIDELAVRGFSFISNTKNHVLPEQIKDLGKNFIEFSNGEKYKKLDNTIIAFNKIIERFEISDDSFFYKIPINGFKNLNKNIESNLLIEVFNRAGFSVSNEYLFTNSIIKDKIDVKSYVVNNKKEEYREKIKDCLYRENFDLFLKYCNNNNIVYLDELIDFNFEILNSIIGFSKNKIENIKIKINHILYKKFGKKIEEEKIEEDNIFKIDIVNSLKENIVRKKIKDYLPKSSFALFLRYCKENDIIYLDELLEFDFFKLNKVRQFGMDRIKKNKKDIINIVKKELDIFLEEDSKDNLVIIENDRARKKIKDYFPELSFALFLKYCEDHKIFYLDELLEFNVFKLSDIKGFGEKRIENTKEAIDNILLKELNMENKSDLNNITIEESIIKKVDIYFKEIPINIVLNEQNNLEKIVLDICKEKNIRFLEELEDIKIQYLESLYGMGKKKIEDIIENLSKFAFSIEDFIAYEYKKIKNDKNYEFNQEKVINRFTLEIMGKVNNITRERVRQRVEKSRESILKFIIIIEKYLINMNRDEYILEIDFLKEINYKKNEEIFTEEDILVICDCIKENKFNLISYFKEIDRIIINRNIDSDKEKIDEVLNRIPAIFELYDVLDLFLEIDIPYLGIDEIEIFLKSFGYKNINNIYSKFTFNNEKVIEFIMIKDYPKGIKLVEENLKEIEKKSKKLFNIQFKNHRSLAATIERGDTIICSPNTYINYKNIKLDMQVIYKIKDYIDEYLYNNDALYCNTLFEKFKDELILKTSFDNYRFLYGILGYFYKDEYRFKKNYIYRNAEEKISKLKILENYIFDKPVVSLKELKEELKWQEYTILQTLPLSKNILLWSPAEYKNINNINFVDNFLEKLEEITINSLKDGYINAETLYKNNEIYFIENGIPNSTALFSVIDRFLGERFYCKRPHILSDKTKEQFTTESLFEKVITKILETEKTFFESDVESYLSDLKLNANSFYIPFTKIKRKYVQIDKKEYCKPEDFNFCNLFIENVLKVICADLKHKNYINISDYNFDKLPEFENNIFYWNPYIIKEIVERYLFEEYKVIKNNLDITNYTKFFILKMDNYIENFEELLLYIVKNEYNNNENLTIPNITSFLKERNIIQKNLPKDFLEHEMIKIDDYGRITIKEG